MVGATSVATSMSEILSGIHCEKVVGMLHKLASPNLADIIRACFFASAATAPVTKPASRSWQAIWPSCGATCTNVFQGRPPGTLKKNPKAETLHTTKTQSQRQVLKPKASDKSLEPRSSTTVIEHCVQCKLLRLAQRQAHYLKQKK